MKRQGIIEIEPLRRRIGKQEGILLLGSCFADEMGERLAAAGYKVMANPFGTLYNPVSIAQAMQIIGDETFTPLAKEDTELFTYGIGCTRYGSYLFNTKASRESPEEFLSYANSTIEAARHFFKESATIIVTLGTAWVYKHIGKQMIVANCHKVPAKEFSRYRLSIDETLAALKEITAFPGKQYIFTVSPIRHLADGEHGNQLSKATLLLATDALISQAAAQALQAAPAAPSSQAAPASPVALQTSPAELQPSPVASQTSPAAQPAPVAQPSQPAQPSQAAGKDATSIYYFPAYEIVMDELRDFRHYAEDTVHPSAETAEYIFSRFSANCLK
ncbi:MAG: GSCFA domain-containing protein [Candidatus Egerieousia sp.]|nr:GSCFA domain-containing protein [Candidatus Egerieousia sp.]